MTAQPSLFARLLGLFPSLRPQPAPRSRTETNTELLQRLYADFDAKAEALARGFRSGRITLDEWATHMRAIIRQQHLAASIIGEGGADAASPMTAARAQRAINAQLSYFDAWVAELRAGKLMSEAAIAARAKQYGKSAGATAVQGHVDAVGAPTLPQYPRDGQTRCRMNCKCTLRIVTKDVVNASYDIYWQTHPAEHCPDCLRLSREWNPLRIRSGRIINA